MASFSRGSVEKAELAEKKEAISDQTSSEQPVWVSRMMTTV